MPTLMFFFSPWVRSWECVDATAILMERGNAVSEGIWDLLKDLFKLLPSISRQYGTQLLLSRGGISESVLNVSSAITYGLRPDMLAALH